MHRGLSNARPSGPTWTPVAVAVVFVASFALSGCDASSSGARIRGGDATPVATREAPPTATPSPTPAPTPTPTPPLSPTHAAPFTPSLPPLPPSFTPPPGPPVGAPAPTPAGTPVPLSDGVSVEVVRRSRYSSVPGGGYTITPTSPDHDFLTIELGITNVTRAVATLELTAAARALGAPLKVVTIGRLGVDAESIDGTGAVKRMQLGPGTRATEGFTFEVPKSVETKDVIVTFNLSWRSNRVWELPLQ